MKFTLALALHNHQPVGNFSAVFEEAHTKCYLPFLELIKNYPQIEFSLHQSGILWDWQKQHHPEFFELVGKMVDSGQVELLSGGFYEPIMPSIPERDGVGQMKMMSAYLEKHFEVKPKGMWLAERVWEPHLPRIINESNLSFLPLDDAHFKYAGLREEQLFGPYITEDSGKTVTLLPILQKLRYLIPFGTPEEVIDYLHQAAREHPGGLAVYADDGEKFGVWPKTFEHCYTDRWLTRFFALLEENSDWLDVVSLGEAVARYKPIGRVYLPSASYREMLHWALPQDGFTALDNFEQALDEHNLMNDFGHFVRGGHWRGFLTKYPESNLMHKKMLAVSDLYDQVSKMTGIDGRELKKAEHLLFAGQCNCPYWHGVFGGLYLPHLRWAIYRKLAEAEKILRRMAGRTIYAVIEDRDRDGFDDIALGGRDLSLVICPERGGQITELISLENNVNIADCLTRRREGYHQKLIEARGQSHIDSTLSIHDQVLTKESGLDKILVDDWYLRRPLTDHFLSQDTSLEDFQFGRYRELGDFILEPFESELTESNDSYRVCLTRNGKVWHGDFHCPVRLEKTIILPKLGGDLIIRYRLLQHDLEIMPINFGVEFDFNLLAPDAEDRYVVIDGRRPKSGSHLAAVGEHSQSQVVAYHDEYQQLGISIESEQSARIWRMPIYTVSLSEGGFEKVFQGNNTLFAYNKALAAGEEFTIAFKLYIGSREKMPAFRPTKQTTTEKV
ncbi:MAG: DUF1926 domain-containing protein [FCB group bacterium]|nr:DUF1926 domain-containing protein [FCB group bacterium]